MERDERSLFLAWLQEGVRRGWCSQVTCVTHNTPVTLRSDDDREQGDNPCVAAVRLYL
jgi:hypothetical protein